jgi:hypothetical protein
VATPSVGGLTFSFPTSSWHPSHARSSRGLCKRRAAYARQACCKDEAASSSLQPHLLTACCSGSACFLLRLCPPPTCQKLWHSCYFLASLGSLAAFFSTRSTFCCSYLTIWLLVLLLFSAMRCWSHQICVARPSSPLASVWLLPPSSAVHL